MRTNYIWPLQQGSRTLTYYSQRTKWLAQWPASLGRKYLMYTAKLYIVAHRVQLNTQSRVFCLLLKGKLVFFSFLLFDLRSLFWKNMWAYIPLLAMAPSPHLNWVPSRHRLLSQSGVCTTVSCQGRSWITRSLLIIDVKRF